MNKIIFCLASLLPFGLLAQNIEMRNFNWPGPPTLHKLEGKEASESAVYLADQRTLEYIYNSKSESECYFTRYQLIHLNDKASIERFNKIYVPVESKDGLLAFKARIINKSGKANEMLLGEMKPVMDDGQMYMSVPLDGLEAGNEIEYFYTVRRGTSFVGAELLQLGSYIRACQFRIISPQNLVFAAKLYNGNATPTDTTIEQKNYVDLHLYGVKAFEHEEFANEDALRMRVEYTLRRNKVKNETVLTYADAGNYYLSAYTSVTKPETKDLEKILSGLKLKGKGEEEQVRAIEGYLKTNFNVREDADAEDLSDAIKKHLATPSLLNKMGVMLSRMAGLKFEMVITVSRYKKPFDADFESWNYLDEMLLYYPSSGLYMMPTNMLERAGPPPFQFVGCSGLFIKEVGLGDIVSAVSKVKSLDNPGVSFSHDNMDISITFADRFTKAQQHTQRSVAGFANLGIRPIYYYTESDKRKEQMDELLKQDVADAKVTNVKVQNGNLDDAGVKLPFIVDGDIEYSSLIEKADNMYLFKVGQVIGPQAELYTDKERQYPVEIEFAHTLDRDITVHVPDGYEVKGLDALNFNITGGDKANPSVGFISGYKMEGSKLVIHIHEFYNQLSYSLADFEQYRKVINASADFNKVSIAFQKK